MNNKQLQLIVKDEVEMKFVDSQIKNIEAQISELEPKVKDNLTDEEGWKKLDELKTIQIYLLNLKYEKLKVSLKLQKEYNAKLKEAEIKSTKVN